jgi:hypothetical protein
VARRTGLEPATPGVTGRYSNQLSYHRAMGGGIREGPGGVKGGGVGGVLNFRRKFMGRGGVSGLGFSDLGRG